MHDEDPLLSAAQAGALLGVSVSTLANWRALHGQAKLPFIKTNLRDVKYRRSAVLAYVAALERGTPALSAAASMEYLRRAAKAAA